MHVSCHQGQQAGQRPRVSKDTQAGGRSLPRQEPRGRSCCPGAAAATASAVVLGTCVETGVPQLGSKTTQQLQVNWPASGRQRRIGMPNGRKQPTDMAEAAGHKTRAK